MLKSFLTSLALIGLVAMPASAQVVQSGSVTAKHPTGWFTNGVVGDLESSGGFSQLTVTNTGTPLCINDALTTATGGYHQLCLAANSSAAGGLISYNAYGGAATLPLNVNINGVTTSIGTGTVNSGTAGQLTYYASTAAAVSGNPYATISNGAVTFGLSGSVLGTLGLSGSSSGKITIAPQAAAGTYNFNLPTTAGSSGQALVSGGGGGSAMTWATFGGTVDSGSAGQFAYYAGSGTELSGSSVLTVSAGTVSTSGALTVGGALTASSGGVTLSPANANVVLSPTGTGVVTINPATPGTIDNVAIGSTTKTTGAFTTLSATGQVSSGVAGSSLGSLALSGNTSGTVTVKTQAAAGTYNYNLPTTAGTSGTPLLSGGGGASPMTYGTLAGNTSTFATTSGALTSGHVATFDASGNIVDSGSAPSGTINSGTANQLTYYAGSGTTVSGNANATVSSGALTMGITGATAGSLILSGSSTGAITVAGSGSTIGTYNFNLPTTAGSSGGPLLSGGGGAAAMTWGSQSGTTTKFGTVTGSLTNGNCIAADASGNLIDNGSPCGSGGSGTVTSSTAGQIAYYASSTNAVAGNSALTISGGAVTVGVTGTTAGSLGLSGSTTGKVTIQTGNAAAGTYNFNMPTTAGSSGQVLTSQGGGSTAMTWTTPGLTWAGVQNTSFSASSNTAYCVDTAGGVVTMTLPGSPADGDQIRFIDCTSSFATNAMTVGRNTKKIMGLTSDMTVGTVNAAATLVYVSANGDWRMY